MVSLSAAAVVSSRRNGGPPEPVTKAAYAEQLGEQIAAKEAQRAKQEALFREPAKETTVRALPPRAMGHRIGGPMLPVDKNDYAQELFMQMEEKERREAGQAAEVLYEDPLLADAAEADIAAAEARGKRCAFFAAPTKNMYAGALKEQMVTQTQRKAEENCARQGQRVEEAGIVGQAAIGGESEEFAKGRKLLGPMPRVDKAAYADELQEQMLARSVRRAQERASSEGPSGGLGIEGLTHLRGRRHSARMPHNPGQSYMEALKQQIEERASARAASAFHRQTPTQEEEEPEGTAPRFNRIGEEARQLPARRPLPGPPRNPAHEYAAALDGQVAARQERAEAQRNADAAAALERGMFRSGDGDAGGRRHSADMQAASKETLCAALQAQMAERDAKRAADASLVRAPSYPPEGTVGAVVPLGAPPPAQGRRHVAPPSPKSKAGYAAALQDQIVERDDLRGPEGFAPPALGPSRPPLAPEHAQQRGAPSPQREVPPHSQQRGAPSPQREPQPVFQQRGAPSPRREAPQHPQQRGAPSPRREVPRAAFPAEPNSPSPIKGMGASGRAPLAPGADGHSPPKALGASGRLPPSPTGRLPTGTLSSSLGRTGASLMGMTRGSVRFADEVQDGSLEEFATFSPSELEGLAGPSRPPRMGGAANGPAAPGRGMAHSDSLERLLGQHAAFSAVPAR